MKPNVTSSKRERYGLTHTHVAMLLAVTLTGIAQSNICAADAGSSNLLYRARVLSEQSYRTKSSEGLEENFAEFSRLLPALSAADAASSGGTPEEAVFRRVVKEAGARPELLNELLAVYGRWHGEGVEQPRITLPPRLDAAHLTDSYRPAWEALLLAPPSKEIEFMQRRFTITRALSEIGNPASIPVLELAFASTCK